MQPIAVNERVPRARILPRFTRLHRLARSRKTSEGLCR